MNRPRVFGFGARRGSRPTGRRSRAGTTLMELMVAVLIITVGLLALASTSATVMRLTAAGGAANRASLAAFSRFEMLRSLNCKTLTTDSASANNVTEKWIVADSGRRKFIIDTVTYYVGQTQKKANYRSMISC